MEFYGPIRARRILARPKMEGLTMAVDAEESQRMGKELEGMTKRVTAVGHLKERGLMEEAWRKKKGTKRKEG